MCVSGEDIMNKMFQCISVFVAISVTISSWLKSCNKSKSFMFKMSTETATKILSCPKGHDP